MSLLYDMSYVVLRWATNGPHHQAVLAFFVQGTKVLLIDGQDILQVRIVLESSVDMQAKLLVLVLIERVGDCIHGSLHLDQSGLFLVRRTEPTIRSDTSFTEFCDGL